MITFIIQLFFKLLISSRYKIITKGLKEIKDGGTKGILFLSNHPALIDPPLNMINLWHPFTPRVLADRNQVNKPILRTVAKWLKIIDILDPSKDGLSDKVKNQINDSIEKCVVALKNNENVLLYPAGHVLRSRKENLRGNIGTQMILSKLPDVRIVLIRINGLWGSSFSWGSGPAPDYFLSLGRGLKVLLKNFIFFTPKRKLVFEYFEPNDFPRDGKKEDINEYMENFYNKNEEWNTFVSYSYKDLKKVETRPEPDYSVNKSGVDEITDSVKEIVFKKIREVSGVKEISVNANLSKDLNLDSLAKLDLCLWLDKEFGIKGTDPDTIETVSDLLFSASGELVSTLVSSVRPVNPKWFNSNLSPILAPEIKEKNVALAFLSQALKNLNKVIATDESSGAKTYRDLLLGIFIIKDEIEKFSDKYIGIMMPSSIAADLLYLGTIFAGKIPVMINWTVGFRNLEHILKLVELTQVLTSQNLVNKLKEQGLDLTILSDKFIFLENWIKNLTLISKLKAKYKSFSIPSSLKNIKNLHETAVILFTSGSENFPKAVPLSHENLITNINDAAKVLKFTKSDGMFSMLPPFHSFGLTAGMLFPLCHGLKVVHYPNPTDAPMISRIISLYKSTIFISTPTFLNAILRVSQRKELESLKLIITGAEKCPERLYSNIKKIYPFAKIIEGYGITECSPIVSVCDPEKPIEGMIGKVLESIEYAIINPETFTRVNKGEAGMLIVRGKSIFKGYLNYNGKTPFINFENKEWYSTGDIVKENNDRVLSFAGRLKRFIKLGGEMISLLAIEEVLAPKLTSEKDKVISFAVTNTEEEPPELVLFTTRPIEREVVNNFIRSGGLSPLHNIKRVVEIKEIPILGTGKTDYRTLNTIYLDKL